MQNHSYNCVCASVGILCVSVCMYVCFKVGIMYVYIGVCKVVCMVLGMCVHMTKHNYK